MDNLKDEYWVDFNPVEVESGRALRIHMFIDTDNVNLLQYERIYDYRVGGELRAGRWRCKNWRVDSWSLATSVPDHIKALHDECLPQVRAAALKFKIKHG